MQQGHLVQAGQVAQLDRERPVLQGQAGVQVSLGLVDRQVVARLAHRGRQDQLGPLQSVDTQSQLRILMTAKILQSALPTEPSPSLK